MKKKIIITIDRDTISEYEKYYFELHPKARNSPIKNPYHESINTWMIMKRPQMNALKQKWKDFIKWVVERNGYSGAMIDKCKITQTIYFNSNRRHDVDNTVPKFILDGFVEGGMIVDDDIKHVTSLTLEGDVDVEHPRTEFIFDVLR